MGFGMKYPQYLARCEAIKAEHPEWRRGQVYFNELNRINPGLADYIRTTPGDPFYKDDNLQPFLVIVWSYATAFGSVKDERPSSNL
jgi:hypothetical protein